MSPPTQVDLDYVIATNRIWQLFGRTSQLAFITEVYIITAV